ncbi:MAG: aminotransferase class I/II-fold pyridoxal phosphate-dependent enzyme [Acidimicrobiales bacterium]
MSIPMRPDLDLGPGYHSPRVDVEVRLNVNESPYPPPAEWAATVGHGVAGLELNRYPDRRAMALRQAIGEAHGVGAEHVLCGNGSNEVIQALMLAYGGPSRRALVFEPTYALHSHISRLAGTEVVRGERGGGFAVEVETARSLLSSARPEVTFLCSPNNPTGAAEDLGVVSAVLDAAPGIVMVDEAYGEFAAPGSSAMSLLQPMLTGGEAEGETNLCVVRTFSKAWSMAGVRLGYLIGPGWLVSSLEKVVLPYHLDSLKQLAGLAALALAGDMAERVAGVVAERERLASALAEMGVAVWPSDANFLMFDPSGPPAPGRSETSAAPGRRETSAAEVWKGLVERSVLVRELRSWPELSDCLRVSVGTKQENDAFLVALEEVLR